MFVLIHALTSAKMDIVLILVMRHIHLCLITVYAVQTVMELL